MKLGKKNHLISKQDEQGDLPLTKKSLFKPFKPPPHKGRKKIIRINYQEKTQHRSCHLDSDF